MYNLIEYSNNYSKTSGSLWQYYRDEPALINADTIANFHAANNSASLNSNKKTQLKQKPVMVGKMLKEWCY